MSILNSLSGAVLRQAAAIKEKIETLEVEFAKLVNADSVSFSLTVNKGAPAKKTGGMSAAGKAKIAAAQRARWAKVNAAKNGGEVGNGKSAKAKVAGDHETGNAKPAGGEMGNGKTAKKKGMSAAGKAKIAAAAKARWAKVRAAKASK